MESTAFFEKKIGLTPKDFNKVKNTSIEDIIIEKARVLLEGKCSEQGFVIPGSVSLISRSMGYFEPARFTGDAVYYAKFQGKVIYPADGVTIIGEVIRKNKMGLYVNYKDAIRIQVPRDLHLGNEEYEAVDIGDMVEVEIKRSTFQINDDYILASGVFLSNKKGDSGATQTTGALNEIIGFTDEITAETEDNTAEDLEFNEEEQAAEEVAGEAGEAGEAGNQLGGDNSEYSDSDSDSDIDLEDESEDEGNETHNNGYEANTNEDEM